MRQSPFCLLALAFLGACGGPNEFSQDAVETSSAVSGGTTYNLKLPLLTNSCVDVSANSSANGANVQEWQCNGTSAQNWVANDLGNGYFYMQHQGTNECLNFDTAHQPNVQQWDCQWASGSSEYQWQFVSSNGYYKLINRYNGQCLDVAGSGTANGTNVQTWSCNGTGAQTFNPVALGGGQPGIAGVVSSSQFAGWFPNRNSFYTYSGLTSINSKYPSFANSSDMTLRKREAAAFLANMAIETGDLVYVVEQNTNNYCSYCDWSQPYGCPAGSCNYYGRGPIQLSWNFNYKAAGDALGYDLLHNPGWVASDANISWQTAAWFWNTQNGPGGEGGNCHNAMMDSYGAGGFGETIKHINGSLECPSLGGGNAGSRDARINKYRYFCDQLGVSYGNNISC
jgi:hypothetical protein